MGAAGAGAGDGDGLGAGAGDAAGAGAGAGVGAGLGAGAGWEQAATSGMAISNDTSRPANASLVTFPFFIMSYLLLPQ